MIEKLEELRKEIKKNWDINSMCSDSYKKHAVMESLFKDLIAIDRVISIIRDKNKNKI